MGINLVNRFLCGKAANEDDAWLDCELNDSPVRKKLDRMAETPVRVPLRKRIDPTIVLAIAAVGVLAMQWLVMPKLRVNAPAMMEQIQTWSTYFVAMCLQAMPFLLGGTLISAVIAVYLPAKFFAAITPKNPILAVPAACVTGMALPGCECASVPVSHSLMKRGVHSAAALTFLLAAPAINPVVIVATFVAFPTNTDMVWARFLAGALVSILMGWFWVALRRPDLLQLPKQRHNHQKGTFKEFRHVTTHDFLHAGGYLVIGAAIAATVNVVVPPRYILYVSENPALAIAMMALFAVIVAMCSEADAFVAASFAHLGPIAQLTFMVVGPAVDVKLIAMQAGTFGRKFTAVFAPVTLIVAIASAVFVGSWLL